MRVLVTGGTGFVGRWLIDELRAAGHEAISTPGSDELDITDVDAVSEFVRQQRPDAVAHLAGVAYAGDARQDPGRALSVNEGGTRAVCEALRDQGAVPVVVAGSSEVYGRPTADDLPLRENAPLRADEPYGLSKLAQERAALAAAARTALPVVVTRSFNMTGPGQRGEFVAPALARRVLDAQRSGIAAIPVGNLDVRRDIGDVRDAVRAYRLLLEGAAGGRVAPGTVVNVCTGRATSIRRILDLLTQIVGVSAKPRTDPELVRANEAAEIVGDPTRLHELTGWEPAIPLEQTLRDLTEALRR